MTIIVAEIAFLNSSGLSFLTSCQGLFEVILYVRYNEVLGKNGGCTNRVRAPRVRGFNELYFTIYDAKQ